MAKRLGGAVVAVMMFAVLTMGSAARVAAQDNTVTRVVPIVAGARQACPNNGCTFVLPNLYTLYVITFPEDNIAPLYTSPSGDLTIFADTLDSSNESLNDFVQGEMDAASTDAGYKLLAPVVSGTLGGSPAQTFAYTKTIDDKGSRVNIRWYMTVHNGSGYALEFTASPQRADAYFNSLGNILNSFQFT